MKTNPQVQTLNSILSRRPCASSGKRTANPVRVLAALVCTAMVSLAATHSLQAAEPNGSYKFVSATGSLKAAGQVVEVTPILAESFALVPLGEDPRFTIKNGSLKINPAGAVGFINGLGERFGGKFDIDKVSGAKSIKFTKTGNKYVGSVSTPVVVKFSSPLQTKTGTLKSLVRAKVKGRKLTIIIPLAGSAMGHRISGTVTIVARK